MSPTAAGPARAAAAACGGTACADRAALAALALAWIALAAIVDPRGEFPLNDDWAYARSVEALVADGELRFSGWTATNLVAQVAWGALFAAPFGFSFTALRLSTLVLGLVGVLASYGLMRELRAAPPVAFLGALVVAANPLYLPLAASFMNDVPFAAVATLTLFLLARGLRCGSGAALGAGLALCGVAILTRQLGLALPAAFAVAWVARRGATARGFGVAVAAVGLGVALQLGYARWLTLSGRAPENYGAQIETLARAARRGLGHLAETAARTGFLSLLYLGLFLAPILIVAASGAWRGLEPAGRRRAVAATAAGAAFLTVGLALLGLWMPVYGNVLARHGVGPVILKAVALPPLPDAFWAAATALAVGGGALIVVLGAMLAARLVRGLRRGGPAVDAGVVLVAAAGAAYLAPILLLGFTPFGFYDRYLVFLVPVGAALACAAAGDARPGRGAVVAGVALAAAMAAFSAAATRDHLALNRARWAALGALEVEGVPPTAIDGGFEFNAWRLYREDYADWETEPDKSWYWVDRDDYAVTMAPVPGYVPVARAAVPRWLGPPVEMLTLRREATP